jgi:hypothetical protein
MLVSFLYVKRDTDCVHLLLPSNARRKHLDAHSARLGSATVHICVEFSYLVIAFMYQNIFSWLGTPAVATGPTLVR